MKKLLMIVFLTIGFAYNTSAQVVVVEKKVVRPLPPRPVVVHKAVPAHPVVVTKVKHKKHKHHHPKRVKRTVVVPAPPAPVVVIKR